MLQYSFSTMLMAVLSCNIIILFTAICFCHKGTLVTIGYKMFALLLGITFLRFLFPFQFPFTINIAMSKPLSAVVLHFRHTLFMVGPVRISFWRIFEFIWAIGSVALFVVYVKGELRFKRTVDFCGRDITHEGHYVDLLDEICGDKPNPFRIVELPGLKVPILYGIRTPYILVPSGMEMPREALRCLLSHEAVHHFHHDILIKAGISLLAVVYWWNPACHLLKAQLDAILEMRVDNCVAGDTFESQFQYLNCLVYVAELTSGEDTRDIKLPENSIALFSSHKYNNLVNRFHVIGEKPKPYSKPLHVAALVVTVGLYALSYLFIFEAWHATPEDDIIESLDSSIYAVMTEDSTYEVYYGGFLMETVDSLEHYNKNTPVYDSLDEVPEELRIVFEQ